MLILILLQYWSLYCIWNQENKHNSLGSLDCIYDSHAMDSTLPLSLKFTSLKNIENIRLVRDSYIYIVSLTLGGLLTFIVGKEVGLRPHPVVIRNAKGLTGFWKKKRAPEGAQM